ncbi:hypothetical protein EMCRGX_G015299 [Ephydatia muelleri]
MESTNHGEGPVAASKRRYIPLNDVLPPLETLVVAIEGSVDPDGVCCLSIPNRVLGDWANNREKNTSFVALANEYIVDEAITLNPEAARLEDILYRKSLGVVSKVRAARGVNRKNALLRSTTITILNGETISAADLQSELNEVTYLNEEADAFIEGLQEEVQDLKDALSEAQDSQNNPGGKIDAVSNRHARRKIQEVSEHANKALEFLSTYGLVAESLKVHTTSGKTFHIPFSDDAASEKEDTVDLRVLYILDSLKSSYGSQPHDATNTLPGHEGAYRSFERSLCEQLSTMIAQDATSFQPNQKIKVRISGDGAKFSRTSSFVLLSYTILMPVGRYLSGIGNHTIAVVKGAEDYDTISTAFAATFQEIDGLQQLGFVAVNGVSYNIELFFSSDMKFMLTMLGLNAANSIYACPKCTVHRDCRWDVSKPESYYSTTMARTLVTNRRAFASHGRTAAVHQGSVNRPLTAIPVDHMMIDELHLFLRIFDVMLRNLIKMSEPQTQQLVAYIRSCGVSFTIWESESSDGKVEWTSLTGEAKKKVLKLLPSKMKDIPLPNAFLDDVVQLWKDFEVLYNLLSSETPPPNAADDIHLKDPPKRIKSKNDSTVFQKKVMEYLNQQSKSSSTDAATKEPILTREKLINKYQACTSAKRRSSDRDQRSTEESLFGMKVCQMEKTRNKTYKRIGDCLRVSGFRSTDTYKDTLQKATSSFDDAAQADAGTLIISMGRVANCPLQNGKPWTLGGYLDELGGSRRITIGVYLPNDTSSDEQSSGTPQQGRAVYKASYHFKVINCTPMFPKISFAQKGSGGNLVTGCTHQAKSGTKVALACLGCDQTCHYHDAVMGLTWLVRVEARRVPPAIDV